MTRTRMLTALAHGLLVTSAVAPAALVVTGPLDTVGAIIEIDAAEHDTLFINGNAFRLQ